MDQPSFRCSDTGVSLTATSGGRVDPRLAPARVEGREAGAAQSPGLLLKTRRSENRMEAPATYPLNSRPFEVPRSLSTAAVGEHTCRLNARRMALPAGESTIADSAEKPRYLYRKHVQAPNGTMPATGRFYMFSEENNRIKPLTAVQRVLQPHIAQEFFQLLISAPVRDALRRHTQHGLKELR